MVVTREPEWDEHSRGRVLRLAEHPATMCDCGCGLPLEVARTPQVFMVEEFTCYARRAVEKLRRERQQEVEDGKRPAGWGDGVFLHARPHDPARDKPLRDTTRRREGAQ